MRENTNKASAIENAKRLHRLSVPRDQIENNLMDAGLTKEEASTAINQIIAVSSEKMKQKANQNLVIGGVLVLTALITLIFTFNGKLYILWASWFLIGAYFLVQGVNLTIKHGKQPSDLSGVNELVKKAFKQKSSK